MARFNVRTTGRRELIDITLEVDGLVRKGRDLEKIVLPRAVWRHLRRTGLVSGNRTVLFS